MTLKDMAQKQERFSFANKPWNLADDLREKYPEHKDLIDLAQLGTEVATFVYGPKVIKGLRSGTAKLPNAVKTLASKSLEYCKSIANKTKDGYKVISSESRQACLNINRYLESLGDKTKRAAGFELELADGSKFSDVKKRPNSFEPVVFEEAEASLNFKIGKKNFCGKRNPTSDFANKKGVGKAKLKEHFEKHNVEFGNAFKNSDEYLNAAKNFLEKNLLQLLRFLCLLKEPSLNTTLLQMNLG